MTGFQSTVARTLGFGVPGEQFLDGPRRAAPFILESNGVPNIIGATAYTSTADSVAVAGGTGIYVGILVNPKTYATAGTSSGGALAANMQLPDQSNGELMTESAGLIVTLPNTAAVGDKIIFSQATGAISSITPATSIPTGSTLIAGATVTRFTVAAAGLAVIQMTGQI